MTVLNAIPNLKEQYEHVSKHNIVLLAVPLLQNGVYQNNCLTASQEALALSPQSSR